MPFRAQHLHAGPHRPGRWTRRSVVGAAVALSFGTVPLTTAVASTTGSTRAQIAAVEQQISSGASAIHALTERYDVASVQAATLTQQLGTERTTLARLQSSVAAVEQSLAAAALRSYTGDGVGPATTVVGTDTVVGAEYLSVASNEVANQVDAMRLGQRQVAATESVIEANLAGVRSAMGSAASARSAALAAAVADQDHLAALQDQLATLEASTGGSVQGGPVGGGLVSSTEQQTGGAAGTGGTGSGATTTTTTTATTAPPATTSSPTTAPGSTTTSSSTSTSTTAPTTPPTTGGTGGTGGGSGGISPGTWLALRTCESGDDYAADTGNGYFGAYQFTESTWRDLGYPGRPDREPPAMQDAAAAKLQAEAGWGQWPACAAALGLS